MKLVPALRLSLTLLSILDPGGLRAQGPLTPMRTEVPPVIDGRMDEALWQEAASVADFKTYTPDFGQPMVGDTRVYMGYDAANLYFAFHAMDPEPGRIKASMADRDNIRRDDWIAINLDSFDDQQSLYAFYANPLGIQGDTRYAGGQEDPNVDLVWFSGGQVDETGYTVEIQIPLKSIRFAQGDTVRMGVIFERHISRNGEAGTFPPLDPAQGESWLTQMIPMVFVGLDRSTLVEVLPAVTYLNQKAMDQGHLAPETDEGEFSLTGKYGITSDLILDGTYNPDFSQVEADAGQVDVNLRYQLYFPEKRAFFREGGEHFAVAVTGTWSRDPLNSVVYTRTIADPIVGAKLAGRVSDKDFLASIYAVDEVPDGTGGTEHAHVPILRYKRALNDDSYLGGIYAGRQVGDRFNRVGGVDGQLRVSGASTLAYHALLSRTRDATDAAIQGGRALGFQFVHSTRDLDWNLLAKDVSEGFRTETGFVQRAGVYQLAGRLMPKFYPASETLRRVDVELVTAQTRDRMDDRWETYNHVKVLGLLMGSLAVTGTYSYATETYLDESFDTGGFAMTGGGQFTNQLFLTLSYQRSKAIFYSQDPYQGRSTRANANLTYQPSDRLRGDFNFTFVDFHRESDGEKIYDYPIYWTRLSYQLNRYLFFRGILEYNDYREELLADVLASFTYIPGTVFHLGYGSLQDRVRWENGEYVDADRFLETRRQFFAKVSYLWRM
jgi:hypothetical protein